jgi:glycosyltransferase involved in cell wall biosynthesis
LVSANYGLGGAPLNIEEGGESTRVLPVGFQRHGNDIIGHHAQYAKADIVITLYDTWVMDPNIMSKFRWCPWLPVDHHPLPQAVGDVLKVAWQPIAYSRHGEKMLTEAGLEPLYVPHGIETGVFMPMKREEARQALKLPDEWVECEFLVVMVAANKGTPSRKAFPECLWAFKEFQKEVPGAKLYLHTHAGPQMQGLDLSLLLKKIEIPEDCVMFCDPYWNILGYPDTYMTALYNSADVLLNPAYGEGFGLPILEAQACGTPVIVGSWTSMPELCFAGWTVEGQRFWTPQGAWQFVPFIRDITEALMRAYERRNDAALRKIARKGAVQYDADVVLREYWEPVLKQIEEEIDLGGALEMVAL